jgi:hypothetical protein
LVLQALFSLLFPFCSPPQKDHHQFSTHNDRDHRGASSNDATVLPPLLLSHFCSHDVTLFPVRFWTHSLISARVNLSFFYGIYWKFWRGWILVWVARTFPIRRERTGSGLELVVNGRNEK